MAPSGIEMPRVILAMDTQLLHLHTTILLGSRLFLTFHPAVRLGKEAPTHLRTERQAAPKDTKLDQPRKHLATTMASSVQ